MKKIITIVTLVTIICALTGLYIKSFEKAEQIMIDDIHDRSFFKQYDIHAAKKSDGFKLKAPQIPSILSYKINHHLYVNQAPTDHGQNNQIQDLLINADCDVQSIYDSQKNTFEIPVSYSNINKTDSTGKLQMGGQTAGSFGGRRVLEEGTIEIDAAKYGGSHTISQDGEYIEGEFPNGNIEFTQRNDRFFLVYVEGSSGLVTGLKAENGIEEDIIVSWMTQQLVNDILPDLRKESFDQEIIHDDNLGVLKIKQTQVDNEDHIHIQKSYNNDNYLSTYVQNITLPQQNYQRNIKLKKEGGIAHSCNSTFTFSHGSNGNQDAAQEPKESLGMVHGHVKQDFQLVESTEDTDNLASEMWRYRNEAEFHSCHLSSANKASFKLGNGEHKPFQTEAFLEPSQEIEVEGDQFTDYFFEETEENSQQDIPQLQQQQGFLSQKRRRSLQEDGEQQIQTIYSDSKKLASVKVFGSEIHVDFNYVVNKTESSITVPIMVNNKTIDTLYQINWKNCVSKPNNWNKEKDITLFQATFPLLGIIVIPVSAKVRLEYGYNSDLLAGDRMCKFTLNPYFKGSLYASGEASIIHVISAGIYAQGTFLDVNLNLEIGSDNGKSYTSLEGNFRAFTLSIGAVYDKFHCSLSNATQLQSAGAAFNGSRRALWPHWHFLRRIVHTVKRYVRKVVPVVKKVLKVARNIVSKGVLQTFCKKSKGYKQIYSKSTEAKHKVFFSEQIDIGL